MNQVFLTDVEIQKIKSDMWAANKGKVSDEQILYDIEIVKAMELKLKKDNLIKEGPTIEKLLEFIFVYLESNIAVDIYAKFSIIFGDTQVGKRGAALEYAIRCLIEGKQCVIVADNFCMQKISFIVTLTCAVAEYNKQYNENENSVGNANYTIDNIMYIETKFNTNKWVQKMNNTKNKVITICLLNSSSLIKIRQGIDDSPRESFSFVFDEADVGTIKDISNKEVSARTMIIQELVKRDGVSNLFVTATPLSFIRAYQLDIKIIGKDVHMITRDDTYITQHKNAKFIDIDEMIEDDNTISYENIKILIETKAKSYMMKFAKIKTVLITTTDKIEKQNEIGKKLNRDFDDSFTVIVNDGDIDIWFNKINKINKRKKMNIKGSVSDGLMVVYNELRKLYIKTGIKNRYNINVIGGKMLKRGASCRTELSKKPKSFREMIICTNQIYTLKSNEVLIDNDYQSATRWHGWYPKDRNNKQPKTVLMTNSIVLDIVKTHHNNMVAQIEAFHENPYKDIRETAVALPEELGDKKICSSSKIRVQKKIKFEGEYYLTKESMNVSKEAYEAQNVQDVGLENKSPGEVGSMTRKIYDILFENKSWMCVKDVHAFADDWFISKSTTPLNTISTMLINLLKSNHIKREKKSGIYCYKCC
jgi:predicted transcriptional regulator